MAVADASNTEVWVQVNCPECGRRAVDVSGGSSPMRVRAVCKRCGRNFESEVKAST